MGHTVKCDTFRSKNEWLMQAWIARPQLSSSTTQSSITTNGGNLWGGKSVEKFSFIESSKGRVSKIFIPDTSFSETGISPASLQNALVPCLPSESNKKYYLTHVTFLRVMYQSNLQYSPWEYPSYLTKHTWGGGGGAGIWHQWLLLGWAIWIYIGGLGEIWTNCLNAVFIILAISLLYCSWLLIKIIVWAVVQKNDM